MMMTVRAMDMAMIEFFRRGGADRHDFHIKIQLHASQRVVAIDGDFVRFDGGDSDDLNAVIGLGLELHAHFDVVDTGEHLAGNGLHHLRIVFAVAFGRSYGHGQLSHPPTYRSARFRGRE
jgi:hypothetical protein